MIPFYVALKGTNEVREIDSRLTYTDGADRDGAGGTVYPVRVRTARGSIANSGGYGFLGNVVQFVEQRAGATITITPIMDGVEQEPESVTLDPTDEPAVEFPFHAGGREVQLDIALSGFGDETELAQCELWLIPRKAHR